MQKFGAFIPSKNFFSTLFDRKNGVAALTPLLFTNELASNIPSNYVITTAHSKLAGIAGKVEIVGTPSSTNTYRGSFGQAVTNLLTPIEKLEFATLYNTKDVHFKFVSFRVTIGSTTPWDGGDMAFYLGNQQVGKVLAANLIAGVGTARTIVALPSQNAIIGEGTYVLPGGFNINVPTNFNIRLSAPTVGFTGLIWVEVITDSKEGGCGTWCSTSCSYPIDTSALYCAIDKCSYCHGIPGFSSL